MTEWYTYLFSLEQIHFFSIHWKMKIISKNILFSTKDAWWKWIKLQWNALKKNIPTCKKKKKTIIETSHGYLRYRSAFNSVHITYSIILQNEIKKKVKVKVTLVQANFLHKLFSTMYSPYILLESKNLKQWGPWMLLYTYCDLKTKTTFRRKKFRNYHLCFQLSISKDIHK